MEGRPLRWEPPSGIGARGLCRPPDPNPDPSRTTEGVEHISRLPDDLLLQVLVRLQCTRAAAHTSLISRCWRGLWRYLPELYFRDITPGALDTALSQVARGQLCLLDIDVPDEHRYSAAGVASLLRTAALLAPVVLSVSVCGDISDRDISVEVPIFERATSIKPNVWNLYLVPPAKGGEFTVLEKLSISGCHVDDGFLVQMTGGACPPTCHCQPLQDLGNQNISLIALEEVALENVRGSGHEVDFVKLVFRCAPLMKRMAVKLAPKVLPSSRGCKEICDIFKANPSVTCYLYSSRGKQVVHA
nr:unnamed protein product [Digitaria exilis]